MCLYVQLMCACLSTYMCTYACVYIIYTLNVCVYVYYMPSYCHCKWWTCNIYIIIYVCVLYPVFRFHCPLSGYNWFGSVLCHAFQHNVWNECLWGWCPDPLIKDHWSTLSYSILIFAGLKNHKTNHNWWRNLPVTNQSTGCQIARLEKWAWDGRSILFSFSKPSTSRLFHLHWTKTRQHQPSKSLKDHLKIMVSRLFHLILGKKSTSSRAPWWQFLGP